MRRMETLAKIFCFSSRMHPKISWKNSLKFSNSPSNPALLKGANHKLQYEKQLQMKNEFFLSKKDIRISFFVQLRSSSILRSLTIYSFYEGVPFITLFGWFLLRQKVSEHSFQIISDNTRGSTIFTGLSFLLKPQIFARSNSIKAL